MKKFVFIFTLILPTSVIFAQPGHAKIKGIPMEETNRRFLEDL